MSASKARKPARLAGLVFALASGCGVGGSVQGTVSSMPGRDAAGAYVGGKPIAGARVRFECAGGASAPLTLESDAAGRFSSDLSAAVESSCQLHVEKPGFRERTYRVADACAQDMGTQCKYLSLYARLLPEGSK